MADVGVTRVLYMEDDPALARAVQLRLSRLGYHVDIAPDGQTGLEMGRASEYHLLVVDQMMPVHTGLDIVQMLAAEKPLPPTILVTGSGSEQTAIDAMRLGVHGYVSKGAGNYLEQLTGVVERVLTEQRLVAENKRVQDELRQERDLLSSIMQTSVAAIVLFDAEGHIVFANDRAERVLGVSKSEAETRLYNSPEWHITDYDGNLLPDHEFPFRRVLDCGNSISDAPMAIEWSDGARKYLLVNGAPLRDDAGAIHRIVCQVTDITERVLTQRNLAWQAEMDAAIAHISSELLAERVSLDDISMHVLNHARRLTRSQYGFAGYIEPDTGHLVTTSLVIDGQEQSGAQTAMQRFEEFSGLWGWVLAHRQPLLTNTAASDPRMTPMPDSRVPIQCFLAVPALFGDQLAGEIALANSDRDYDQRDLDLVTRLASVYAMGLRRKWDEDRLLYLSTHDALTGLYNRAYFEEQMKRQAQSNNVALAIAVVDVDDMKAVNDARGHVVGDDLLRRAARVLQSTFRSADVVARIGGDEFAVLVSGARQPELRKIAARVRERVALDNTQHADVPLSFSLGIAVGHQGISPTELLRQADAHMYQEKASKKLTPR